MKNPDRFIAATMMATVIFLGYQTIDHSTPFQDSRLIFHQKLGDLTPNRGKALPPSDSTWFIKGSIYPPKKDQWEFKDALSDNFDDSETLNDIELAELESEYPETDYEPEEGDEEYRQPTVGKRMEPLRAPTIGAGDQGMGTFSEPRYTKTPASNSNKISGPIFAEESSITADSTKQKKRKFRPLKSRWFKSMAQDQAIQHDAPGHSTQASAASSRYNIGIPDIETGAPVRRKR